MYIPCQVGKVMGFNRISMSYMHDRFIAGSKVIYKY